MPEFGKDAHMASGGPATAPKTAISSRLLSRPFARRPTNGKKAQKEEYDSIASENAFAAGPSMVIGFAR